MTPHKLLIKVVTRNEIIITTLLLVALVLLTGAPLYAQTATVTESPEKPSYLISPTVITTKSRFTSNIIEKTEKIQFSTIYKDDAEMELDEEKVIQEGKNGKIIKEITITYYDGNEFEREVTGQTMVGKVDEIILRGTKIIPKTLKTPGGDITYYRKIRMWATSYHPFCKGCSGTGRTSIGLKAGRGVAAVDPAVIKLGSQLYVPGYGKAIAGDTGGAVKGKKIDLGFEPNETGVWSSRFVDVYLLI